MRIITKRGLIRTVADRWYKQYYPFRNDSPLFSERMGLSRDLSKQQIYTLLAALDKETATDDQVANIIGNSSWTRICCHECGASVDFVVEIGEEEDYESHTACICKACIEAVSMVSLGA